MSLLNAAIGIFFYSVFAAIFGNLFIGIIEAKCVQKVYNLKVKSGVIVLANYFSAAVGFSLTTTMFEHTRWNMVYGYENSTFGESLLANLGLAYLITLIVELPFYYWASTDQSGKKVNLIVLVEAIIIVHFFSYLLVLAFICWMVFT